MSEQVKVTPEQARRLVSSTGVPAATATTPTITSARTRSEDLPDGSTLGVPTVELSGTADPDLTLWIYDRGVFSHNITSDSSSRWTVLLPSLARGEHVFTALAEPGGQPSNPWRINVTVGERIQIRGLRDSNGFLRQCGAPIPVTSADPVGTVFVRVLGEPGTSYQIANSGESPEPPPPGSLLWGPARTLTAFSADILESRLGSAPVLNWYHVRTADSGPEAIDKCLGNFVRVVSP